MRLVILLLFCARLNADFIVESYFPDIEEGRQIFLLTFFLPYNLTIYSYTFDDDLRNKCVKAWPKADIMIESIQRGVRPSLYR